MLTKRPSVSYLKKKYNNLGFFLSDFFNIKVPVLPSTKRNDKTIERLRKDGYTCVFSCNYWHIFYKE